MVPKVIEMNKIKQRQIYLELIKALEPFLDVPDFNITYNDKNLTVSEVIANLKILVELTHFPKIKHKGKSYEALDLMVRFNIPLLK